MTMYVRVRANAAEEMLNSMVLSYLYGCIALGFVLLALILARR